MLGSARKMGPECIPHTLVSSHVNTVQDHDKKQIEYCCPVWDPAKTEDIANIESIQRNFTRKIANCKDLDYWERLKKLKLMSF